jgi:hypothetical protein
MHALLLELDLKFDSEVFNDPLFFLRMVLMKTSTFKDGQNLLYLYIVVGVNGLLFYLLQFWFVTETKTLSLKNPFHVFKLLSNLLFEGYFKNRLVDSNVNYTLSFSILELSYLFLGCFMGIIVPLLCFV